MNSDEFDVLIPYFEVRSFDKKEQIVRLGEVDNYFNIIAKGLVRKYTLAGKKEVTLQLATKDMLFILKFRLTAGCLQMLLLKLLNPLFFFLSLMITFRPFITSSPEQKDWEGW